MNQLNLIGRLTRDPELRSLPDGKSVCDMRIAVDGGRADADPLYLDIAAFGEHGAACARYLNKGRQVAFSGRLVYREWETGDGAKRSKHSAIGHVEFLGKRPEQNGDTAEDEREPAPVAATAEEAIAF